MCQVTFGCVLVIECGYGLCFQSIEEGDFAKTNIHFYRCSFFHPEHIAPVGAEWYDLKTGSEDYVRLGGRQSTLLQR
jgi:hypothetical protein